MKKIVSLFQRNYDGDRLVRDEVTPGAEWVVNGEGVATRKFDGTCCMVRDGKLYKRYELKRGKQAPIGFEAAQEPDTVTGDIPGWVAVGDGNDDKWHREAWDDLLQRWHNDGRFSEADGTYELCGPKVQGNPEGFGRHVLIPHGGERLFDCPCDFEGIKEYLRAAHIEGIVWHHPDGRMVKIKTKDFGLTR